MVEMPSGLCGQSRVITTFIRLPQPGSATLGPRYGPHRAHHFRSGPSNRRGLAQSHADPSLVVPVRIDLTSGP
jgi:hypothetical protein